jgi:hypothetical protein
MKLLVFFQQNNPSFSRFSKNLFLDFFNSIVIKSVLRSLPSFSTFSHLVQDIDPFRKINAQKIIKTRSFIVLMSRRSKNIIPEDLIRFQTVLSFYGVFMFE